MGKLITSKLEQVIQDGKDILKEQEKIASHLRYASNF